MKKNILAISLFIFIFFCIPFSVVHILTAQPGSIIEMNRLPVPPILKPVKRQKNNLYFELTVQRGVTEFVKGSKVITYGYNGSILGPTIRVKRGQNVNITVRNRLREYTTVHWHGMLVPGEMDGGPHQVIRPDKKWNASFKINQPAATAWYHPHGLGNTAIQVYRGLAGLFIVDDDISEKLNIPDKYGINDIPLVVQDKRLTSEGEPVYLTSMRDIMIGMTGNTILVNGVINPYFEVNSVKYRFRLLNGSNARVYNFRLNDGSSFYQIATDAGFIEKPLKIKSIILSPGERAEVIVDFSKYKKGQTIDFVSGSIKIIKFKVMKKTADKTKIPGKLAIIKHLKPSDSKRSRVFSLEGSGRMVSINGRQMNINRIDEYMRYRDTEIWTITNSLGGMMRGMMGNVLHNFHAHGIHFQILDRNGKLPYVSERGWKDTVLLDVGDEIRVITRFLYKGIFMYHCHILEHEDNGMMGQFKVE